MTRWGLAATALAIATPAFAHSYRIVLDKPANGKLLIGHAGVQAVDDRTASTLVRVVAPGNAVDQRGTVRVLVMNLGAAPFQFGPDDVSLTLGDGTQLKPVPVDTMEKMTSQLARSARLSTRTGSPHSTSTPIRRNRTAIASGVAAPLGKPARASASSWSGPVISATTRGLGPQTGRGPGTWCSPLRSHRSKADAGAAATEWSWTLTGCAWEAGSTEPS